MKKIFIIMVFSSTLIFSLGAYSQDTAAKYAGMWSDPPDTPEGLFCFFTCSDYGLDVLNKLLDDPANDDRSYSELTGQARREFTQNVIVPKLTAAALETFPLDPAQDPGFIRCEPWGFAKQIFSPHQNEITIGENSIEMHYGEWDARRTIYMDGRSPPENLAHSIYGFSVGHFEGEELVVTTTHISAGILGRANHSDQLTSEERYSISEAGELLTVYATFEDPWSLKEPLTYKRIWKWSPDEVIYPYDECEIPTDFIESQGADQ